MHAMPMLLIVEDEQIERESLQEMLAIDYGAENVYAADSAPEAITLIKSCKPDIILLDIILRNSSGFDVAYYVKQKYPHITVIFLTAHNEFDFAHTALNIGVTDYLLKPVRPSILREKIQAALRLKETAHHGNIPIWPFLHHNMVREVTSLLPFCPNYIAVSGIYPQEMPDSPAGHFIASRIRSIGWLETNAGQFILYLRHGSGSDSERCLEDLNSQMAEKFGVKLISGLSHPIADIDGMPLGYAQAQSAYQRRVFYDKPTIIKYAALRKAPLPYPLELEADLLISLSTRQPQDCTDSTERLAQAFLAGCAGDSAVLLQWYKRLVVVLQRFCGEKGDTLPIIRPKGYWSSAAEFSQSINSVVGAVLVHTLIDKQTPKPFVNRILKIIQQKFSGDISLKQVSQIVGINPAYVSRQFKQQTGESFKECLTRLRLEHAKKLLSTSGKNVSAVAKESGFSDPNYFCEVFKKRLGHTPSDYRAIHGIHEPGL
jgi:two-component system response regulator YesN